MISIRSELLEKKQEADQMLKMIDEAAASGGGVLRSGILKSSHVLMLYNIIESTVSLVFERLHDEISKTQYIDLSPPLKVIWVDFFFGSFTTKAFQSHLDGTMNKTLLFPTLKEFTERIKLFSGNLDARRIDQLLRKYGVGNLSTPDRAKLLIVKSKRNKIAHGEVTFKEGCRDLTSRELLSLQKATFSALESIVKQTEAYFLEQKFRIL